MSIVSSSLERFRLSFQEHGDRDLHNAFSRIEEACCSLVGYVAGETADASVLDFSRLPTDRAPSRSVVLPQCMNIGTARIRVSDMEGFESVGMPLLLPLSSANAWFFDLASDGAGTDVAGLFENIALRLALSIPDFLCRFHMVDLDFGSSFSAFLSVDNADKRLYCRSSEVETLFSELMEVVKKANFSYLGRYPDLSAYNKANPDKAMPYHFVFIDDFPQSCPWHVLEDLNKLIKNGNAARAGICFFLNYSQPDGPVRDFDLDFYRRECAFVGRDERREISFSGLPDYYDGLSCSKNVDFGLPGNYFDLAALAGSSGAEAAGKAVQLADVAESDIWSRSSIDSIRIPYGLDGRGACVEFVISSRMAQNSAVVVGASGTGKSKFLHSLILSAALHYSPDELEMYLLDFSGVEFNTYALHRLPHARVIAPESEREFGLSVLREIREEGFRREVMCRDANVNNVSELRKKAGSAVTPQVMVVIDEFQKLFESNDEIGKESSSIITQIIKEYRKYGINLVLATQMLSDLRSDLVPVKQIGNRVVFKCSPSDGGLIGYSGTVPDLENAESYYNNRMGDRAANVKARTFMIDNGIIDGVLDRIYAFSQSHPAHKVDTTVFRSAELPVFRPSGIVPSDSPAEVKLFLGRALTMRADDVCAVFDRSDKDNLLIIGGERPIAERMAIYASSCPMGYHTAGSLSMYFMNFMRDADPLREIPSGWAATGFETHYPRGEEEIFAALQEIYGEIEARRQRGDAGERAVYIFIYAFELAQAFKKENSSGRYRSSRASALLASVLNAGPLLGVHVVLQVDSLASLAQVDDGVLDCFNHRAVLQLEKRESNRVVGSDAANRLYDETRPASAYRAYYHNQRKNMTIKFKPYG